MSWRETLGAGSPSGDSPAQYSHNAHNSRKSSAQDGNSVHCVNSVHRSSYQKCPVPPPEQEPSDGVLYTNFGRGYRHKDGRIETGKPEPAPPAAVDWPADLDGMLRRVSVAFEWTQQDVRDFIAWARRSPAGLEDARAFLQSECDKLDVEIGECGSRPGGNLVPIFGHAGFMAPEQSSNKSIYRRAKY